MSQEQFSARLLAWFDHFGRKDLPWQRDKSPYRVWVSEIMLQQTLVTAVIPYFLKFIARFDSVASLAQADLDAVLHHWSGLGYYARARNLHKAAQLVCSDHAGALPIEFAELIQLPGIGKSTAGAILACAMGQRHAILDGNVKRVLCRYHGIAGYPGVRKIEQELWHLAEQHTPHERVADYTQAIMDFGATLCTRRGPHCDRCPISSDCRALATDQVSVLPTPKPRSGPRRHETTTMLCLISPDQHWALIKRPAKGIWGGLWCPFEFASRAQLAQWCAQQQLEHSALQKLGENIAHSFTHYDLTIRPYYLLINAQQRQQVGEHGIMWYNTSSNQIQQVGLATPVSALLRRIQKLI